MGATATWEQLPINKDANGQPEIHYTRIYSAFRRWEADGCFDALFTGSVLTLQGTIISLDGVYDCPQNRKAIFNRGMVPNIKPNRRGRKAPKRGRKPIYRRDIVQERFSTIERVFAWEDKFKRLLLRFERISRLHYALKSIAYTMINLRHFCRP